jgi:hypothetical protein
LRGCSFSDSHAWLSYPKESVSVQVRLGGNLNVVKMRYKFILLLATSVAANFDDTCTVTSGVKCTDMQDEDTSKYSKGKVHVHWVFVKVRLVNASLESAPILHSKLRQNCQL